MAVEVKMPDLGTTVDTVKLVKWLKKEGDQVKRGEALCDVETDKGVVEPESIAQGTLLKQVVPEETDIAVGTVIAYVGEPGEVVGQ